MDVIAGKILIVGGGTGGHITPGIALYEEMSERGIGALFLTRKRDNRFDSFGGVSTDDLRFYRAPSLTRNIIKLPFFAAAFLIAVMKARTIIKNNSVAAVIGMGGYVSAPALSAAKMLGVPIFLCEQNSVPGMVTKLFQKYAVRIYSTLAVTREHLKEKEKLVHTGNPIRKKILTDMPRMEARKVFNLTHEESVILAIGGSQGAVTINELVFGLKKEYADELKEVGIIWSAGAYTFEDFRDRIQNEIHAGSIYISPYIKQVGAAYRAVDCAICRSGAGVIMELAAMGVPSIQIPYPHAAMQHQELNARAFADAGAAVLVPDNEANPETVFPILMEMLQNRRKLKKMADAARAISRPDASALIVSDILGSGVVKKNYIEKLDGPEKGTH